MTDQEQYDSIIAFYTNHQVISESYLKNEKIADNYKKDVDVYNEYNEYVDINKLFVYRYSITLEELIEVNKFKDEHPEYFI